MSETQQTESAAAEQEVQASPSTESANGAGAAPKSAQIKLGKEEKDGSSTTPSFFGESEPDEENASEGFSPARAGGRDHASSPPAPFVSKWAHAYNACARIGPVYLLVFICLMVWPDYWQKGSGSFCPPEIQSATAYLHCIQESSWLAPTALANGAWSVPQWPLFYIFIGLLALIPGLAEANWLIPLACASSAAIAILGAFFFTHAAGFGCAAAFAGALILCCAPIFAPLHHFFGPVTLATGLMLFSLAFFCRGWRARRAWISLPLAFICAALAGLCGGVLYIAVPLLGSLFYLIWQGEYKRGQSLDAVTGFLLLLIIIGLWIGAIMLGNYPSDYLNHLLKDSIHFSWPPQPLWYLALAAGALGLLPWLLIIFGVSWLRVLKDSVKSFSASRHDNGSALMWLSLVLACCLSVFVPNGPIAAITIGGLLAPLLGKAFIRMPDAGNRFFFFLASVFTMLVGCLLLALHFAPSQAFIFKLLPVQPPAPAGPELLQLAAVPVIAAICILGGAGGFYFVKRFRGGGGLLYASLVAVIIGQVALFMVAPKLKANPNLPLKTLDAIAREVEAVKKPASLPETAQPAPAPAPLPPAPEQVPVPEPAPLPAQPETEPPAQSQPAETLPNLNIPSPPAASEDAGPAPAPESAAPQPDLPEAATPPVQENAAPVPVLPQTPAPLPAEPQAEPGEANPEKPANPAGEPMILPDAIEVPADDGQARNNTDGQSPTSQAVPENSGESAANSSKL